MQEEREIEQQRRDEQELIKKIAERQKEADKRKREEDNAKQKEKIAALKREAERQEQERQKAIAKANRDRAIRDAAEADAEARQAAADAKAANEALASIRSGTSRQTAAMQSSQSQNATGREQGTSPLEQQYWALVSERLRSYWKMPEGREWNPSLLASVVITISRDGQVNSISFDRRSSDPFFDQLVEKTIRQASPMPSFPAALQKSNTQVGFNFKPGGLGNR